MLSAPITVLLLVANGIVSTVALFSDPFLIQRLGFRPARIREHGEWYRFITAGFVHVGLWHLAFNLFTLYSFGPALESRLGAWGFLILYVGSELSAHALTWWLQRNNKRYNAVGASGAISGVLFGYCLFEPFNLLYLFGAVPIPAFLFAIGFVVISAWSLRDSRRIAHEAHLGGALGGLLITILLYPDALLTFLRHFGL